MTPSTLATTTDAATAMAAGTATPAPMRIHAATTARLSRQFARARGLHCVLMLGLCSGGLTTSAAAISALTGAALYRIGDITAPVQATATSASLSVSSAMITGGLGGVAGGIGLMFAFGAAAGASRRRMIDVNARRYTLCLEQLRGMLAPQHAQPGVTVTAGNTAPLALHLPQTSFLPLAHGAPQSTQACTPQPSTASPRP